MDKKPTLNGQQKMVDNSMRLNGPLKETPENISHTKQFDLPSFKCPDCSYQSIWKHAVKRHQRIHFRDNEIGERSHFQCVHCSYTTDDWKQFKDHQTLHITSPQSSKDCSQIKSSFRKRKKLCAPSTFKCELWQHEPVTEDNHQCDDSLFGHVKQLHGTRQELLKIKETAVKFDPPGQSPKRKYMRGKYANVPVKITTNGLFECDSCPYQTAIRTALVKHQTNHQIN